MSKISSKQDNICNDPNCPFHGQLSLRGRMLEGTVVSAKMKKSVIVRIDFLHYIPKYKRYERRHSHIPAHNPPCIDVSRNNKVRISECRPLSKTVSFVILEKMDK
jgi:small subunit ribosomal protein S17